MKKIYLLLTFVLFLSLESDAQSWVPLGTLATGVRAIAISPYDGSIYAGGTFTGGINYLAKYNTATNSWSQIGSGINGPVYALSFFKNKLYIGGLFTNAGGVAVSNIASLTSADVFSGVGTGLNNQVNCLYAASDSSLIYAGGIFSADPTNTTSLLHIASFNLTAWSAVGNGLQWEVNTLVQYSSKLYAGTIYTATPVYALNASTWSPVAGLTGGAVYTLASYSGFLYAGGNFTSPNNSASKYNGTAWSTIITALSNGIAVRSFRNVGNSLFIGGTFTNVGVGSASYIGRIDGPTIPIKVVYTSNNPGAVPYSIATNNGYVYLGGDFSTLGSGVLKSSTTIGVDEINDYIESSSFFPNPMTTIGTLNVKLKKHASNAQLSIIDAQGKIVAEQEISDLSTNEINFSIDRNEISAGIYYYRLKIDGTAVSSHPFIIE